ncbi:MAG: hypothetical protein ABI611_05640 [Solirubrobacteraceae bacterium]
MPVAKSTISAWVRDIPLDEQHRRALEAANPAVNGRRVGQRAWSRACREELDALRSTGARSRAAEIRSTAPGACSVRRPLLHGTAELRVGSTWIVQSIYGAIQEYAGFDRPEWLD